FRPARRGCARSGTRINCISTFPGTAQWRWDSGIFLGCGCRRTSTRRTRRRISRTSGSDGTARFRRCCRIMFIIRSRFGSSGGGGRGAGGKSVWRKAAASLGGFASMVAVPTMLTMLLGGLWHGANWTFVFWGGYHGLLLTAYQFSKKWYDRWPKALRQAITFALVVFGLIFFRCETFGKAATILVKMFTWQYGLSPTGLYGMAVLLPIAAWWAHIGPNVFEMSHDWRGWKLGGVTALFLLAMVSITAGDESPFLYFQF